MKTEYYRIRNSRVVKGLGKLGEELTMTFSVLSQRTLTQGVNFLNSFLLFLLIQN